MIGLVKKIAIVLLVLMLILAAALFFLAQKPAPERISYGMSFNTPYAIELGLNWREAYDAIVDELGVRHLRLAAHWPMVEPSEDQYSFVELDYQPKTCLSSGFNKICCCGTGL